MEKRLRLVYEVENGNRRFPMGYEFDCYNLDADYNVWDVIFETGHHAIDTRLWMCWSTIPTIWW